MENYLIATAIFGCIYALLALGLNVAWGMAGIINLGLAGFFAVGAYVSALLTLKLHLPIAVGLLAGAIVAAASGTIVALITARLRGDYLAIVTLGFSEAVRIVASNEIWLTNGTDGLSGIPGPYRGQIGPEAFNLLFLGIMVAAVAGALLFTERLRDSPFGRVLRAIRDDEQVTAVAGKYVIAFKVKAFAVSAAIMGVAGGLYGHYTSYIAPDIYGPLITINIVLALVAGGRGNNYGSILGGFLVIAILEATRFLAPLTQFLSHVQIAALRELIISVGLILILRFRPDGLLAERRQRIALPAAAAQERSPPFAS